MIFHQFCDGYFKNIYYFWELLDWILFFTYGIQRSKISTFSDADNSLHNGLGTGIIR